MFRYPVGLTRYNFSLPFVFFLLLPSGGSNILTLAFSHGISKTDWNFSFPEQSLPLFQSVSTSGSVTALRPSSGPVRPRAAPHGLPPKTSERAQWTWRRRCCIPADQGCQVSLAKQKNVFFLFFFLSKISRFLTIHRISLPFALLMVLNVVWWWWTSFKTRTSFKINLSC